MLNVLIVLKALNMLNVLFDVVVCSGLAEQFGFPTRPPVEEPVSLCVCT